MGTGTKLHLVVCDDDPAVRTAIRLVAEDLGHAVIGETDHADDAVALASRFGADALILDLSLAVGSGYVAIAEVAAQAPACRVVVFSAYCQQVELVPPVVATVDKPDVERLADVLAALPELPHPDGAERRLWTGTLPVRRRLAGAGGDPAPDFYAALADARSGDAVVVVRPEVGNDIADLAATVRRSLRAQDWMLTESTRIVLLLVGGNPLAAEAVKRRLPALGGGCTVVDAVVGADEAPGDTLLRLTGSLV